MSEYLEKKLQTIIGLTFGRNNRHDFFGALAQVLMTQYSQYIRWIRCEGWQDDRLFGIYIPELKKYEERYDLQIWKCKFTFFIGVQQPVDITTRESINTLFLFLNDKFSPSSSDPSFRFLMLDWFWHLMLLSKGAITNLKEILLKVDESSIIDIVDRVILGDRRNSFADNPLNGNAVSQLAKAVDETANKYYEYFGDGKDFRNDFRNYLCARPDLDPHSISADIKSIPGKLSYLKSIEFDSSHLKEMLRSLESGMVDKQAGRIIRNIINEDLSFLDFRSRYYDLLYIYLKNECHPFFFIYNPFLRSFFYRGVVFDLDGIDMQLLDKIIRGSNLDTAESEIRQAMISQGIQAFNQDQHISPRLFINSVNQPFDEELIKYLFCGRKPLWHANLLEDFDIPEIDFSKSNAVRRYVEQKILRIYGNSDKKAFVFYPLVSDGQYRGNLYFRCDRSEEMLEKLLKVIPILSENYSKQIEEYYYEQFLSKSLEAESHSVDSIIKLLPYLLNVELAGIIPIVDDCSHTGTDGLPRLYCNNYTRQQARACEIWGFKDKDSSYNKLNLRNLKCRGNEKEGRCLWDVLYLEGAKIRGNTKVITIVISISELIKEIALHAELPDCVDIRQSYERIYTREELLNNDKGLTATKLLVIWKLNDEVTSESYLMWCVIDMAPWEFNKNKAAIVRKFETIKNTMNEVSRLNNSVRIQKEIAHELSEYPHIIGQYSFKTLRAALKFKDYTIVEKISEWDEKRLQYFRLLRGERKKQKDANEPMDVSVLRTLQLLKDSYLLIGQDNLSDSRKLFRKAKDDWDSMLNINGADFVVWLQESALMSILENLVTNSIKHARRNGKPLLKALRIYFELETCDEGHRLRYRDNGDGIPADRLLLVDSWRRGDNIVGDKGFGFRSIEKSKNIINLANGGKGYADFAVAEHEIVFTFHNQFRKGGVKPDAYSIN